MISMQFGYTTDRRTLVGRAVCYVTAGPWSHCLTIFRGMGEPFYFESIGKWDKTTGKTGVRGPIPLKNLQDWVGEAPGRSFATQPAGKATLPFAEAHCEAVYDMLCEAVHDIGYAYLQCANNWLESRTGIYIHIGHKLSRRDWTCSELCTHCIPSIWWKEYGLLYARADEIVPSGNQLLSLWDGTKAVLRQTAP